MERDQEKRMSAEEKLRVAAKGRGAGAMIAKQVDVIGSPIPSATGGRTYWFPRH